MSQQQQLFSGEAAKTAIIDPTGRYRYRLGRIWDQNKPRILFVMLNPSTADADIDDPTIRRCVGFAKREGAGGLDVVNLFAYRATDPKELKARVKEPEDFDPIGPDNDTHILAAALECAFVVAAWGAHGKLWRRDRAVEELLRPHWPLECLGRTKAGHPRHPLYLRSDSKLQTYRMVMV